MPVSSVNIAHIVINHHGHIFHELIELLSEGFSSLGIAVTRSVNRIETKKLNLIIGHTAFLQADVLEKLQRTNAASIVYQLEVLDDQSGFIPEHPHYLEYLRHATQIWEYSPANLPFLARHGCGQASIIPLGYSRALERIVHAPEKDIDVFLFGAISPRRRAALDACVRRDLRVQAGFGIYGTQRDELIGRSKIILNVHQFETKQLEQLRVSYLLNNRCFVISESAEGNSFGDGIVFCDYDKLADCCVSYLRTEAQSERSRIAEIGYANLKSQPFVASIQAALEHLDVG